MVSDDEISAWVRKQALRPLAKLPRKYDGRHSYFEALDRLDQRALGERALNQLVDVLASEGDRKKSNWGDFHEASKQVELAKILYASRRITKEEFVLFAVVPVEAFHDTNFRDGAYASDLKPLSEAMEEIEKNYGLSEEEYWEIGDAPDAYVKLNDRFEEILDAHFVAALRQFQLDELADLKRDNPKKFDELRERGRRSVYHADEYFHSIKDIVVHLEKESKKSSEISAFGAAVTSLGAATEGLLILRCLGSPKKAARIARSLERNYRPRRPDDPTMWSFDELIRVCDEAGWLRPVESESYVYNSADLAHLLRTMRNNVHPGRRAKANPWSEPGERDYRDARAIYEILCTAIGKLRAPRLEASVGPSKPPSSAARD
ncbi:hypothetical protein V6C03_03055 [Methyloligella sp. 2.7D]|uniref:hypothetical protein n=1 Tax=unclassified Methyloligella TaxID=2625955 RepID=UPI00157CC7CD|nr:hypothetical protein [Methyloligella sp. GL2]QKP76398.1 hypothetical protein HT051_02365 [Methyloligella sp. GL2]